MIGGVVVTESVFTIPGLGRLTVDAVLARDYPTIQAVILLFSFVYVMINLAVDMIYTRARSKDSLLMADVILDTRSPAPAKPAAAFRKLLHNPGVVFGATVIADRIADGAARAVARHHRSRPRSIRSRATRSPARSSRCGPTPANASR